MKLKDQKPELFNLFMINPNLAGYVVGLMESTYKYSPGTVTENYRQAIADFPGYSNIESLIVSLEDTLVEYHAKTWQDNGNFNGYGFIVEIVDDIIKDASMSTAIPEDSRVAAKKLLDGTYLRMN